MKRLGLETKPRPDWSEEDTQSYEEIRVELDKRSEIEVPPKPPPADQVLEAEARRSAKRRNPSKTIRFSRRGFEVFDNERKVS